MNEIVIVLTAALGVALGYTIGVLSNNFEESKHVRQIEEKN